VGSSRQLAVGPVAVTSLLLNANLNTIIPCSTQISNANTITDPALQACQAQYNQAAIQVAFIVSILYTGMGVLQMGWVTKFLSHAVIGGFTTGAAITIAMGQVKYILGFKITMGSSTRLQDYLQQYINGMRNLRWQEFIMGVTFIFVLIAFKEGQRLWKPLRHIRSLGALFVCIAGICAIYIGKVNQPVGLISIIGFIPSGLPGFTGNLWIPMTSPTFEQLLTPAIIITAVDLLESTSIARALARKNKYELHYNREIIGLGLANIAGAMSNCYTTTGSFSRSAVNNNAGSKSPLAQFVCGWIVGFVLLWLTGVFANVPYNAMAAIIIVGVTQLVEIEQAIYLWKVNKLDLLVFLASCFGTLFYSIEVGLAIAIGLAVLMALYQTAFPHTAILGKVPGSTIYRNIKQYKESQVYPGILAFRIDAPLYFGNVTSVEDKLEKSMEKASAWSAIQGTPLQFLILDLTPVHHIDSMGLHMLEELVFRMKERSIQLMLANPGRGIVKDLERVNIPDLIGREFVFVSVHEACQACLLRLADKGFNSFLISQEAVPEIDPSWLRPASSLQNSSSFRKGSVLMPTGPSVAVAMAPIAEEEGNMGNTPTKTKISSPNVDYQI
jgi:sulfate transporter 4